MLKIFLAFYCILCIFDVTCVQNLKPRKCIAMYIEKPKFIPIIENLPLIHQGKTRDTFETRDPAHLLIVATDRLSTHDIIHRCNVLHKGEVLTALTVFWITQLLGSDTRINHHLKAYGKEIYDYLPGQRADYPDDLHYRAIIVRRLDMIPVEFIYRSYLSGSLFKKYYSIGIDNPYGVELGKNLKLMCRFRTPVFTPTEKSATDDPLRSLNVRHYHPAASEMTLRAFSLIQAYLRSRNIVLIDGKFEAGKFLESDTVAVGDEIATPDSSRFCEFSEIKEGKDPSWLDKQIARDEAERIWGSEPKRPLAFGPELVDKLSDTYRRLLARITDLDLQEFQNQYLD